MIDLSNIKRISCSLQDTTSREVFSHRLMYSLTGDKSYILPLADACLKSVLEASEWTSFIKEIKKKSTNGIYIYGAGVFGKKIFELTCHDVEWNGFIDKSSAINEFCGLKVFSLDEYINNMNSKNAYVVIPSKTYYESMYECLVGKGISKEYIIDGRILYDLTEGKQYFDLIELPHAKKEVFVDAGCCDGNSTVAFMDWCGGNGYSYCFEPDGHNYELVKENFKKKSIDKYEIISKGVWDKETTLSFVSSGDGQSHVSDIYGRKEQPTESVPVTSIDSALADKDVTFIKMDIEGAELNALMGAKKIIESYKPKLAICLYHKTFDILDIPSYILSLRSDYKLYMRHYSFGDAETVLYAF